jgi:hypothetical protein
MYAPGEERDVCTNNLNMHGPTHWVNHQPMNPEFTSPSTRTETHTFIGVQNKDGGDGLSIICKHIIISVPYDLRIFE